MQLLRKACEEGQHNGCFNLSVHHLRARRMDDVRGAHRPRRGTAAAAAALGATHESAQALYYAVRACDMGHVGGCINASKMLRDGDGVARDEQRAEALKKAAELLMRTEDRRSGGAWSPARHP